LGTSGRGNIWIFDVAGAAQPLKLTFKDHNTFPVWSPDGKQIAFLSVNASGAHIFSVAADGSALEPQQLTRGASAEVPLAWSPDSASILFYGPQSRLWLLQMSDRSTTQWLPNHFTEFGGAFSPDGQWIAYGSNQTGRLEIWVRPFGGAGAAVRISSDGGHDPVWTRDGREILYTNGPQLMSARVMADARGLGAEPPRVVLESGFIHDDSDPNLRFFDAASDGRLLVIEPVEKLGAAIVVVQHWGDELNGLRPGR
jgi:serine/threonine-protein kinase